MKKEKQQEARVLRRQGKSIRCIAKALSVSKSSVSHWVRDIKLTKCQRDKLQSDKRKLAMACNGHAAKRKVEREAYRAQGKAESLVGSELHRMGSMLYWAEGDKSTNVMTFANTDAAMIKLFHQFLLEVIGEDDDLLSKLHFVARIHDPTLAKQAIDFWGSMLDITIKIEIVNLDYYNKNPKRMQHNKHPMGCLYIRANSTRLQQRLLGSIEGYVGQDIFTLKSDWERRGKRI